MTEQAVVFEFEEGRRFYSPRVEVDEETQTMTPIEPFVLIDKKK